MGILTLLRNAFGRSRKGRSAEEEPTREPQEPTVPAQSTAAEQAVTARPAEPEPTVPAQSTEPEPTPTAAEPTVPAQSSGRTDEEHELVAAAFDNVTVPRQPTHREDPPATETPEPTATEQPTTEAEPEPQSDTNPEAEPKAKTPPEPEAEPTTEVTAEAEAEPTIEVTAEAETKAEAEAEPEPIAEVTAEAETEAEAEAEPEPTSEVTAETETEAEPEPEPEAEPEVKPEAETAAVVEPEPAQEPVADTAPETGQDVEAEPEPQADTKPEAEPEAEAPEPAAAEQPATAPTEAPAAADGEEAPQEAPAPEDTTRTGGAGGNTPAEGEAEAEAQAEAQPPAEAEAQAEAEPTAEAQPPAPQPEPEAIAPGLLTAYKAAATVLDERRLTGTRAKVYLVLDRSASMRPYYKDGSAQALGEQALALAAHLDPEATVPVVFFSTELDGTGELTLADYEDKIDTLHASLGRMGRTSYHAAVEAVIAHHDKSENPTLPALVIFQTDGAPDAKTPATQSLTEAAKSHPHLFFSFIAFGDPENKAFDYVRKLKTDNTSHFLAGETPRELTDAEVYEGVLANWRP
ncbi:VWA domain-containing protein [Streptomyces cynarae]|uniref:VWA domain-containing protein n=1 Tax=Streptomyces cynarae TaxID=2981134 RepID=A0ABY6E2R1_9ACTN|nr:VWA domain-containing protein [Streptomyces cynarae]UXY20944.1 VWA domain-containing protein [Streptomyces cynarae]